MKYYSLVAAMSLACTALGGVFPIDFPTRQPGTARELLGEKVAAIVSSPAKLEIFRVDSEEQDEPQGAHVEGYKVLAVRPPPGEQFAARAAEVLLSDATYDLSIWGQEKWCGEFAPGVALRFIKGDETATALICYKCSDVVVVLRDAQGQRVYAAMGDFKPGRGAMVRLAKQAFPDDQVIQQLEETVPGD